MSNVKEYQLYNTFSGEMLGEYATQSHALSGLCEKVRERVPLYYLDLFFQRKGSNALYLCSARDEVIKTWLDDLFYLGVQLRLEAGTDVMGLRDYVEWDLGESIVITNSGGPQLINMTKYIAVHQEYMGRGATETEALGRMYLAYVRGVKK